jgi:hypothetical protein
MSKPGVKTNANAWQPTTQAPSKEIFTAKPFPEIGQQEQETVGYGEKAAPTASRSGMIANINHSLSTNPIPAVSHVGMGGVQAKLAIGEPGDQYEQEADRVAADVVQKMNNPEAQPMTSPQTGANKSIQRQPVIPILSRMPAPREMQRKNEIQAGNVPQVQADFEGQLNQARGGGSPLDAAFRAKIEPAMGADFSAVRVHTDSQADQMSQAIQAKAFTTGSDVFFRQGAYEPGSRGGQELIAHELTHVVQRKVATVQRMKVQGANTLSEVSSPTKTKHVVALANQATQAEANYGDSTFVTSDQALTAPVNANTYNFTEPTGTKSGRKDIQANVVIYQYNKTGNPPGGLAKNQPVTLAINGVSTLCEIGVVKGGDDKLKITHFKKV